jgi:hypothetical protein
MVKEHIELGLEAGQTSVTVTFWFTNHGPKTTVTMAFPELQKSVGHSLANFRSWVDGKETEVSYRVLQDPRDVSIGEEAEYKAVWLKNVAFSKNQSRVVTVSYVQRNSFASYGTSSFKYILRTGASWHGKIEEVRVTYDKSRLRSTSEPYFVRAGTRLEAAVPEPTGKSSGKIIWKDVDPDFNLLVNMCPGKWKVEINGVLIDPGLFYQPPQGKLDDIQVPEHSLGDVFSYPQPYDYGVSKRWALARLDPSFVISKLRRGIQKVDVEGDEIEFVYLRDAVEALGGTYRYDPDYDKVYITVPTK